MLGTMTRANDWHIKWPAKEKNREEGEGYFCLRKEQTEARFPSYTVSVV